MNKEYKELKEKGTEGLADVEELGVEYMNLELSSFKSTKEFVEAFKKSGRQLHVLICNAGIMARNYGKHHAKIFLLSVPKRCFFCGALMLFLSCFCYTFVRISLLMPCGQLLGKCDPFALVCDV